MGRHARVSPVVTANRSILLFAGLAVLALASSVTTAHADEQPTAASTDLLGDSRADLVVGVPRAASTAGALAVVPGGTAGLDAGARKTISQNTAGVPGTSEQGDAFGTDTATGDVDGDGRTDLVVGVPGEDDTSGHKDRGAVTVLTSSSGLTQGISFTTGSTYRSPVSARLGTAVAVGDFDGDGRDDVAGAGLGAGAQQWGWLTWRDSATGALTTDRTSYANLTHVDLAAGDFNGDGYDDLAVATVDVNGQAVVYEYQSTGTGGLKKSMAVQMNGGRSIAAGDIDGDGRDDIAVGQPVAAETAPISYRGHTGGQVTLKFGQDYGLWYRGHTTALNQDTAGIPGAAEAGDSMGASVALADADGDGHLDVLAGVPGEDLTVSGTARPDAGAALVLRLSLTGQSVTVGSAQALQQGAGGIRGVAESGDRFGSSLTAGRYAAQSPAIAIGASGENAGDGTIAVRPATGSSTYLGRTAINSAAGAQLGTSLL